MTLERLGAPGRFGSVEVRNRMVMPAMLTNHGREDGTVSEVLEAYYVARAAGGVGAIIVEAAAAEPRGRIAPGMLRLDDDRCIPGLRRLYKLIRERGATVVQQIYHGGRNCLPALIGDVVAPSAVASKANGVLPRALRLDEIEALVEAFGQAARRVREAGAQVVELNSAHGHLVAQFLSPYANKRTDHYGGSAENRMRFPREIIARMRKHGGDDLPILVRFSGSEFLEGGLTLGDQIGYARRLEAEGVAAVDVSAGNHDAEGEMIEPIMAQPPGCVIHLAEAVKQAVGIPVIGVGRINSPALAEAILREGKADFIALGRALIADPDFPRKALEGRWDEIRPCIYCNYGCIERFKPKYMAPGAKARGIGCTVNAEVSREGLAGAARAAMTRRVLVCGGGPAGLEAARVAALRGHRVTLWERGSELGGMLRWAGRPIASRDFENYRQYLVAEVTRLGVRVALGREATPEAVLAETPDAVIVATGSRLEPATIAGVLAGQVAKAQDLFEKPERAGARVVIVGAGVVGLTLADLLAEQGRRVTVVDADPEIEAPYGRAVSRALLDRLARAGARLVPGARAERAEGGRVHIARNGDVETLEFDTLVVARERRAETGLAEPLRARGLTVRSIGDCVEPRSLFDAVNEGADAARSI